MDKSTGTKTKVKKGTIIQWNELHKGAVVQHSDPGRAFKGLGVAKRYCRRDSISDSFVQRWSVLPTSPHSRTALATVEAAWRERIFRATTSGGRGSSSNSTGSLINCASNLVILVAAIVRKHIHGYTSTHENDDRC